MIVSSSMKSIQAAKISMPARAVAVRFCLGQLVSCAVPAVKEEE